MSMLYVTMATDSIYIKVLRTSGYFCLQSRSRELPSHELE